jgi:RNA polymerase sigma factor (sigma-70 family)
MARARQGAVLRQIRALFDAGTVGGLTDGQLLERFTTRGGEAAELAFAALVERHGPMVLRTCRAVLRDPHEAHDAFQATFLVLVRRAGSLWARDSLAPWLHQVARRTACCARSAAARRLRHERTAAGRERTSVRYEGPDDLGEVLDEELTRLPEPFRSAVVLCLVEGLTHEQAAHRLGWPVGTVESRLARGRARLRARLNDRGLAPTVGAVAAALGAGRVDAAVPPALARATVRAALRISMGQAAGAEVVSATILTLVESVSRTMSMSMMKMAGAVVLAVGLAATGAGVWASQKAGTSEAGTPQPLPSRSKGEPGPAIVARVDGKPITRDELIERCLEKYGAKELKTLVAMATLRQACERHGITVTDEEVEAEAARVAAKFKLPLEDWYRTLSKERDLPKQVYLDDVVRPGLMYKKLDDEPGINAEDLLRKAHVEVFFEDPRGDGRGAEKAPAPARSQNERLRDVERKLEQTIKALESLKREVGR